jgi:signal transduction histidine kinase
MLTSVSPESIALCREQLLLLGQGLGAELSVVYLTEQLLGHEGTKLIPIVVEPETAEGEAIALEWTRLPDETGIGIQLPAPLLLAPGASDPINVADDSYPSQEQTKTHWQAQQLVLPLVHEGVAIGLLTTSRSKQTWTRPEQQQIERVAKTIALACILDRRSRWWENRYQEYRQLHVQQRDILDNLLHQFRNPLTALKIFGKLLFKRLQPGDPNQDYAGSIVQESDRLQEMVQNFKQVLMWEREDLALPLDVEIIEPVPPAQPMLLPGSGEPLSPVDALSILRPLVASAKAIADDRQLTLVDRLPDPLPPVLAHAQALREVLSNLIDNALKYTPAGGRVEIEVTLVQPTLVQPPLDSLKPHATNLPGTANGGPGTETETAVRETPETMLAIAISDTGPGIPSDDLLHLFERGYRGVQAEGAIAGTGLGLAIARDLVTRMQGEIQVFSPPPNQTAGSRFIVWLQVLDFRF